MCANLGADNHSITKEDTPGASSLPSASMSAEGMPASAAPASNMLRTSTARFGDEFSLAFVWVPPRNLIDDAENDDGAEGGTGIGPGPLIPPPPETWVLCVADSATEVDTGMSNGDGSSYPLFVCPASDPRVTMGGKAAVWTFAGGAVGKTVVASRQTRLASVSKRNGRVGRGLLQCLGSGGASGPVCVATPEMSDSGVASPLHAGFIWHMDLLTGAELLAAVDASSAQRRQLQRQRQKASDSRSGERILAQEKSPRKLMMTGSPRGRRIATSNTKAEVSLSQRPAFSPVSPSRARDAIDRSGTGSISVGSPYLALQIQQKEERSNAIDRRIAGRFTAAGKVSNRFVDRTGQFLHSPDKRCLRMEQEFLRDRAMRGLELLNERLVGSRKSYEKRKTARNLKIRQKARKARIGALTNLNLSSR